MSKPTQLPEGWFTTFLAKLTAHVLKGFMGGLGFTYAGYLVLRWKGVV